MDLSMWMLANRLAFMDMDVSIRYDSPAVLKSARLACATNCVRVFQKDNDCICACGDDSIRIHDIDISEAFELVQSVFDFYQEWSRHMSELAAKKEYQSIVDNCWQVFHNPMVIMDGNCRVLGLSRQYQKLDDEWEYMKKYGHSSVKALQYMRREYRELDNPILQSFAFSKDFLNSRGMTCPAIFGGALCGRINIFERERALNAGDSQLLQMIATLVASSLGSAGYEAPDNPSVDLISNLLDGREVREDDLDRTMSVMQWRGNGFFKVAVLNYRHDYKDNRAQYTLMSTLYRLFPESYILVKDDNVVIIFQTACTEYGQCENSMESDRENQMTAKLVSFCQQNDIILANSLPLRVITNLNYCYSQAMFALQFANLRRTQETQYDFYSVAIDYIIKDGSIKNALRACHPDIMYLEEMQDKANYNMIETLKCYLDNNRSVLHTANAMFLHRNSMVYRIQRITECLHYSLDDAYSRDYMRLSIRVLELYNKRHPGDDVQPDAADKHTA